MTSKGFSLIYQSSHYTPEMNNDWHRIESPSPPSVSSLVSWWFLQLIVQYLINMGHGAGGTDPVTRATDLRPGRSVRATSLAPTLQSQGRCHGVLLCWAVRSVPPAQPPLEAVRGDPRDRPLDRDDGDIVGLAVRGDCGGVVRPSGAILGGGGSLACLLGGHDHPQHHRNHHQPGGPAVSECLCVEHHHQYTEQPPHAFQGRGWHATPFLSPRTARSVVPPDAILLAAVPLSPSVSYVVQRERGPGIATRDALCLDDRFSLFVLRVVHAAMLRVVFSGSTPRRMVMGSVPPAV